MIKVLPLVALVWSSPAVAGWASFQTANWAPLDGSPGAPAGVSPQLPNILNGLAVRPPWKVAGVDYGVGIPAGTSLLDPATTANWSGACAGGSLASNTITVSGSGTCTLNALDFSLHNGMNINIADAFSGTLIVTNSNFLIGSNQLYPITSSLASPAVVTVSNNNFDSGGSSPHIGGVGVSGGANITITYNYFARWDNDVIRLSNAGGNSNYVVRYNVMQSGNWGATGSPCANGLFEHPDQIHSVNGAASIVWQFNTSYQPAGDLFQGLPGSTNSFLRASDVTNHPYQGTEIGYNTWTGVGTSGHQLCNNVANGNTHTSTLIDNIDTTSSTGIANGVTLSGARVYGSGVPASTLATTPIVTGATGSFTLTPSATTTTLTATPIGVWNNSGAIGQIIQYGGLASPGLQMFSIVMHDNYFNLAGGANFGAYLPTAAIGSILSENRTHNIDMSTGSIIP
jgi:hypothetical protein